MLLVFDDLGLMVQKYQVGTLFLSLEFFNFNAVSHTDVGR